MKEYSFAKNEEDGHDEITNAFLNSVYGIPEFSEATDLVRKNSIGGVWLVGGFVYRNIIKELYGMPLKSDMDFDFIVENKLPVFNLPTGWVTKTNSYGNPKLVGPRYEIDYIPINNIHSILRRSLDPNIENFFSGVPLTVQSIGFDVICQKVVGNVGIKSIKTRTVGINNIEQARYRAQLKGHTLIELVNKTACDLGFVPLIES